MLLLLTTSYIGCKTKQKISISNKKYYNTKMFYSEELNNVLTNSHLLHCEK